MEFSRDIHTGFYSKKAYKALMLVNCLEAGCSYAYEYWDSSQSKWRHRQKIDDYSMNSWVSFRGLPVLPAKYTHVEDEDFIPWVCNSKVLRDYSTGEIIIRARCVRDALLCPNWFIYTDTAIKEQLSYAVTETYNFVNAYKNLRSDTVLLESEGTAILQPWTFYGMHPRVRTDNSYWGERLLGRLYHGREYVHEVSKQVLFDINYCWKNNEDPRHFPDLIDNEYDPFRLQVEKESFEQMEKIYEEAIGLYKTNEAFRDILYAEPEKFFGWVEENESKQRALQIF